MNESYEQIDVRNVATYPVADAARYLAIPAGTLRTWLHGRTYPTVNGDKDFEPLIHLPEDDSPQLSFTNLVEAHVLRVIRQSHKIRLDKVRTALDYVEQKFGLPHPLARAQFQTDGIDLFVESVGHLINASRDGQLAMQKTLQQLLRRIEWDEEGLAQRLFSADSAAEWRRATCVGDRSAHLVWKTCDSEYGHSCRYGD